MERQANTEYVLSLSYGKDSIACIEAIKRLNYPLDRIVHAEVWATDTLPADLPQMVEFKKYADAEIKKRWGLTVEHICAMRDGEKLTFEKIFYKKRTRGASAGKIFGFPTHQCNWCNSYLKMNAINKAHSVKKGWKAVRYVGITADEKQRIQRHITKNIVLPLVDIGWTEQACLDWCKKNNLLSPIYQNAKRGGCWFCHNITVGELRTLRSNYPDLWGLLLKWDLDSPYTFLSNHTTVHDFELRFAAEDNGIIDPNNKKFRWSQVLKSKEEES